MTVIQAIILGIIQGLTEFIPVSSSGHIYTVPTLLGWESVGLDYSNFISFIHLGTLLSLLYFFRKRIWRYILVVFEYAKKRGKVNNKEAKDYKTIVNILISVIPAAILGLLLSDLIDEFYNLRSSSEATLLVAIPMIFVGFLFLIENRILNGAKAAYQIGFGKALIIGFSQVLAFVRGVSRSGITLLSGQLVGLTRVSAAEFSFLMGIPIIGGAALKSLYDLISSNTINSTNIYVYLAGAIASFVAGNFAIKFMLNFLQTRSLKFFGIYRIAFGLILVLSSLVTR